MFTNETELKDGCEILLQAATPEIYRINAFRISGLDVNASTREISNQLQKNQLFEKYGNKSENTDSPFPIHPKPDTDQIRQALHRLRDPETRIIDEFFWFWPHSLEPNQKDNALELLSRKEIKSAESLWISYEATLTESNVSKHNLAVLSHLLALEIELNGNNLTTKEDLKRRDKYWKDTFKRWKLLLGHEGFWRRLMARVRQTDDPRLTTGFVKRLRESLPTTILQINALLALKAAESDDEQEAIRHLDLMRKSGFSKEVVAITLKRIVNPLRSRIKVICKSLTDETQENPESELIACKKILKQTKDILKILDILLPTDSVIKEGAHDEVALTGTNLAISCVNATKDYESIIPIFEELKKIVKGESARIRVEKNYDIFKSNLEYFNLYNTCFYCKKNKANDDSALIISMHGEVNRDYVFNRVTWKHLNVEVPRCMNCKKEHNYTEASTWVGGGIGLFVGIVGALIVEFGKGGFWTLVGLTGIGLLVGWRIGLSRNITAHIDYYRSFPRIADLIDQGWHFGKEPNTD